MVPSAKTRAMLVRAVAVAAPFGCRVEKLPPKTIEPLPWTAMARTDWLAFGLKVVSSVPLAFRRAMRPRAVEVAAPLG